MRFGRGGMGLGGGAVLLVLSLLFGRNLFNDVGAGGAAVDPGTVATTSGGEAPPANETAAEKERVDFVAFVLNDVQDTWRRVLPPTGTQYSDAKLRLYRDAVQTGCGDAESSVGPFYCPVDHRVYIDLSFYDELSSRFGANGDFAQAYVLAHELGHHVQTLQGTDARMRQMQRARPDQANQLSVRLELQADCYAGVWANSTSQRRLLDQGDVQEALNAASAVGDDRLQKQSTGTVRPDTFTHGTAAQRASWFQRGFQSGNPQSCDTFAGAA